jgi:hypothetical protein
MILRSSVIKLFLIIGVMSRLSRGNNGKNLSRESFLISVGFSDSGLTAESDKYTCFCLLTELYARPLRHGILMVLPVGPSLELDETEEITASASTDGLI